MYVAIDHTVTDSQKWAVGTQKLVAMVQQGQLPEGVKAVMFLPSVDGRKAHCVWEANSVDALKKFLEPEIGTAANNEYIAINAEASLGLPK